MIARMKQQGLDRLADVLVEDILCTPGDQLLAEVAEDCGNARALADTFDKIVFRARSSHDRLAAKASPIKASPIVANQILSGPLPKKESSHLAEQLRTLWQNVIPSVFDIIFPNRLVMIGVCSACIASLAVIAAAPKFFDRAQEQNSSEPTGTKVFDGGPAGPESVKSSRQGLGYLMTFKARARSSARCEAFSARIFARAVSFARRASVAFETKS